MLDLPLVRTVLDVEVDGLGRLRRGPASSCPARRPRCPQECKRSPRRSSGCRRGPPGEPWPSTPRRRSTTRPAAAPVFLGRVIGGGQQQAGKRIAITPASIVHLLGCRGDTPAHQQVQRARPACVTPGGINVGFEGLSDLAQLAETSALGEALVEVGEGPAGCIEAAGSPAQNSSSVHSEIISSIISGVRRSWTTTMRSRTASHSAAVSFDSSRKRSRMVRSRSSRACPASSGASARRSRRDTRSPSLRRDGADLPLGGAAPAVAPVHLVGIGFLEGATKSPASDRLQRTMESPARNSRYRLRVSRPGWRDLMARLMVHARALTRVRVSHPRPVPVARDEVEPDCPPADARRRRP